MNFRTFFLRLMLPLAVACGGTGCDSEKSAQSDQPGEAALPAGSSNPADASDPPTRARMELDSRVVADLKQRREKLANEMPVPKPEPEPEPLTPTQKKLGPEIVAALKLAGGVPADGTPLVLSRNFVPIQEAGRALVDLDATVSTELLDHVVSIGGKVVSSSQPEHTIRAMIPVVQLEALVGRADVHSVSPGNLSDMNQILAPRAARPGGSPENP